MRAGTTGFAKALAKETAPFGIQTNVVVPNYWRSEIYDPRMRFIEDADGRAAIAQIIPFGAGRTARGRQTDRLLGLRQAGVHHRAGRVLQRGLAGFGPVSASGRRPLGGGRCQSRPASRDPFLELRGRCERCWIDVKNRSTPRAPMIIGVTWGGPSSASRGRYIRASPPATLADYGFRTSPWRP